MIDLNVRVLTELSLAFIDTLARHRGGLLNVGSMAGFSARPGNGRLLCDQGLRVVVHRGLAQRAQTEFGDRAGLSKRSMQGPLSQSADYVAEAGYRGLMQGRRTIVPGAINKLITFFIRITLAFVDHRLRRRRSVGSA
jgi:uncharacterized protein